MTTQKNLIAVLAAALVLGVAVPTIVTADVTEAQIAAAKTAADHEAIAKAYESDAAAAEASAREHETMVQAYKVAARAPKGESAKAMVTHCEGLVKAYRSAATEYRALAAEHRKLATAAGK